MKPEIKPIHRLETLLTDMNGVIGICPIKDKQCLYSSPCQIEKVYSNCSLFKRFAFNSPDEFEVVVRQYLNKTIMIGENLK